MRMASQRQQHQHQQTHPRNDMRTTAKLALACGAVALASLAGCDDSRQADKRVQAAVDQARIVRLKEGPDAAQTLLQKAVSDAEASKSTQAHAKSVLASAEMDAAAQRISDPEKGINKGNREIARLMWEIG